MAVHADHCFLNVRYVLENAVDQAAKFLRNRIAHGIRDIEGDSAGFDSNLKYLVQIGRFSPAGIHW